MKSKQILNNLRSLLDWKQKVTFLFIMLIDDSFFCFNAAHAQSNRLAADDIPFST